MGVSKVISAWINGSHFFLVIRGQICICLAVSVSYISNSVLAWFIPSVSKYPWPTSKGWMARGCFPPGKQESTFSSIVQDLSVQPHSSNTRLPEPKARIPGILTEDFRSLWCQQLCFCTQLWVWGWCGHGGDVALLRVVLTHHFCTICLCSLRKMSILAQKLRCIVSGLRCGIYILKKFTWWFL